MKHLLPSPAPQRVVCIGAHCDDIEIGCGGAVAQLARSGAEFTWVVLSGEDPARRAEAERSAQLLLGEATADVVIESFRESYFPWEGDRIKDRFEQLKDLDPDLVLTHHLGDRHQDHRLIAELTYNTFRDHLVVEYEIPKFEGDLVPTNTYVPLSAAEADEKIEHLMKCFPSQRSRAWFDEDTFRGLMRLRGVECAAPGRFAEGFHCRKFLLGLDARRGVVGGGHG